jgi:hypothetical protein
MSGAGRQSSKCRQAKHMARGFQGREGRLQAAADWRVERGGEERKMTMGERVRERVKDEERGQDDVRKERPTPTEQANKVMGIEINAFGSDAVSIRWLHLAFVLVPGRKSRRNASTRRALT